MPAVLDIGSQRVLVCDSQGERIDSRARGMDLVGEALGLGATMVAIPVARIDDVFFELRSGIAGEIAQAAVNYGLRLAIIGDIGAHVARSNALRDWVTECNRGGDLWFVTDLDALKARLA